MITDWFSRLFRLKASLEIKEMDLERDYSGIAKLFEREEWPFLRGDLEISHSQPKATSFVAYKIKNLAGFFATHNFRDIGYLDMMIIAPEYRKDGAARRGRVC